MPDTPIDLSEGIQSVRLKVPTAEVPIPPEGFAQLHSPAPGELALRLPDGSVVPVGGGGGGGTNAVNLLGPNGQVLTNGTEPGVGIDITPIPTLAIRLSGPVQDANGQPQAPEAVTLLLHDDPPSTPIAGKVVLWLDGLGRLHAIDEYGGTSLSIFGDESKKLELSQSNAGINGGGFGRMLLNAAGAEVVAVLGLMYLSGVGVQIDPQSDYLYLSGLPTADPHVADAVWVSPITRQLMVSAG